MYNYWRELEEVLLSIQNKCNIALIEKDKCIQDQDKFYQLNGSIMLDQNQIAIIIDIYIEGLQILKKYDTFRCLCYSLYRLPWKNNHEEYKIYTNVIESLEKYLNKKKFFSLYQLPGIKEINEIVSGLIIINESDIEDIYQMKHLDKTCYLNSEYQSINDSYESEEIEEKFIQEYEEQQEQIIPQSVKQNVLNQKSNPNNNKKKEFSELQIEKQNEEVSHQNYKESFQELGDEIFCDEQYQQNNQEKFYQKEYYVTQLEDMAIKSEQEPNNQDQNLKKRKLKETDYENLLDLEKSEYIGKENHKKLKVSENQVYSNNNNKKIQDQKQYQKENYLPILNQDCTKKRFDNLIKKIYPKRDFKFNPGLSPEEKRQDYFERLDQMLKQLNLNVHFKSIQINIHFNFECECFYDEIINFSPDLNPFVFNYRGSKRIKVDNIKFRNDPYVCDDEHNIQVNSDFPLSIEDESNISEINCKQSVTLFECQENDRTFSFINAPIIILKDEYFSYYFEDDFDSINDFFKQFYDTNKIYLIESEDSQRIEVLDQKLQSLMIIVVFEDPLLDFCLTYPIQYLLIDLYLD